MARQIQLRRGTTSQNDLFIGAEGELTMDTTAKDLRLQDGTTPGGGRIPVLVDIQRPTADNNYTWYRLWSDKWVEQGWQRTVTSNGTTVPLAITMADTLYNVTLTPIGYSGDGIGLGIVDRAVNSIIVKNKNYGSSVTLSCICGIRGYAA